MDMKNLTKHSAEILCVPRAPIIATAAEVSKYLDTLPEAQPLNCASWTDFPVCPQVKFKLAYSPTAFYLKYYVHELHIRAINTEPNSPVCQDSCVEFFFTLDGDKYYNIEFNCVGVCHLGFGHARANRNLMPIESIKKITTYSTLGTAPIPPQSGDFNWELTALIPLSIFGCSGEDLHNNKDFRANFYKCGDLLPEPHYLSWQKVNTPAPDFHQPDFFAPLSFT